MGRLPNMPESIRSQYTDHRNWLLGGGDDSSQDRKNLAQTMPATPTVLDAAERLEFRNPARLKEMEKRANGELIDPFDQMPPNHAYDANQDARRLRAMRPELEMLPARLEFMRRDAERESILEELMRGFQ